MERTADRQELKKLGVAIGAATGPVAAYGQAWAGTGDGRLHVWFIATAAGALLGALTYPLFVSPYRVGFAALFGFAVGLVAGAFAAFPMGSAVGSLFGAVAGAVVVLVAKRIHMRGGPVIASALGAVVALFAAWWWFQ